MLYEEPLGRGLVLLQDDTLTRIGTDSVVLGAFMRLPARARVCDLGAGSGVLSLLACVRSESCTVTGVEIQPAACRLLEASIARNALAGRLSVLEGDLRQIRSLLPAGRFDCVVSNPPYFRAGPASPDPARAAARRMDTCTTEELCAAAAWLLHTGGSLSLVHRPEQMADLFCAMRAAGIEPKRLQLVRHHEGAPVNLILIEGRKGGRPGLQIEPDLPLYDRDGAQSAQYRALFPEP